MELSEKRYEKMDEILAYRKAHSPEERMGQEFKSKMEQYGQELYEMTMEKCRLRKVGRKEIL